MKDIIISRPCVFCGKRHEVAIDSYEYGLWEDGMRIQDAMPKESAEVREFLISGICPKCQSSLFDSEEDEEEEFDEDFDFSDFEPEEEDNFLDDLFEEMTYEL